MLKKWRRLVPIWSPMQTVHDLAFCSMADGGMGIYCQSQINTACKVTSDSERGTTKLPSRLLTVSLQPSTDLLSQASQETQSYPPVALGLLSPWVSPPHSFPDLLLAAGHGDAYLWNPLLPVSSVIPLNHPTVSPVCPPLLSFARLAWILILLYLGLHTSLCCGMSVCQLLWLVNK